MVLQERIVCHPELAEGSLGCTPAKRCFGKLSMTE